MIITKNAYYVDLGKTGSSFVEDVIQQACDSNFKSKKGIRHKGFDSLPSEEFFKNNLVFTSIRNPFTYYVSHLTFSRKTNGSIWKGLKTQGYRDELYSQSVEGYVQAMMEERMDLPERNHNNPERVAWRNMPDDLGMLTMQFVLLLDRNFITQKKRTTQEIKDWYEQYWFNTERTNLKVLGKNNLTLETVQLLRQNKEYFPIKDQFNQVLKDVEKGQLQTGKHKIQSLDYKKWHTNKSRNIIQHYDRILIKHMNYDYDSI